MTDDDDDTLDGCELDFREDADDELAGSLRALFPAGVPADYEGVLNAPPD